MREATVVTDRAAFRAAAREAAAGTRIPVEVRVAVADPFDAYRRARDGGDGAFLETSGGQSGWGYFGVDPVERLTVRADATVARRSDGTEERDAAAAPALGRAATGADAPTLAALEGLLDGTDLARGDCEVPVPCGAIGWLSYDVARELESLSGETTDDRQLPRLQLAVFDRLAAWECPADAPVDGTAAGGAPTDGAGGDGAATDGAVDRAVDDQVVDGEAPDRARSDDAERDRVTLHVTACPRLPEVGADLDEVYERGRRRALDLVERIEAGDPAVAERPAASSAAAGTARAGEEPGPESPAEEPASDRQSATFESECGREAFADRVRTIQERIRAGDTFQVNVSQRLTAPAAVHPVAAFDALRQVNPAPYSALLELPAADLVSASPELLLEREGDAVRTEPIAGTRPRGTTPGADEALERELLADEKERAEHAMLVDLERNDLGKVCRYGSVDVAEYRRVDRYSEVMHLVSLVEGSLRDDATLADAIAATFPGGTITGAPKPETMALIDEVEATRRGPYTGSIGLFGFDGRATLNIVIRTLVRHADEYHLRVGAGVVHDSVPEREYAETLDKARALVTAVDEALGERTDLSVAASADAEAVDACDADGGERR